MRFEHQTGYIIAAILLGAMVLGAGLVAGTVLVADASTNSDGAPSVPRDLTFSETAGNEGSTISVSGTGSVSAEPDQAVLVVAATAQAENASEATAALANRSGELRSALQDAGIGNESIRTVDFTVGQQRETANDSTFVAQQTFEVTLNDTSGVGETIDVAVENGASEVYGVRFEVSDERVEELRATAIDRAVADARDQAGVVASSTNLTVGSVNHVDVVGSGNFGRTTEAAAGDGGTDIDVSPVTVSVSVEVTYNATATEADAGSE